MANPITYDRFLTEDFFTLVGLQDLPDDQKAEVVEKMNQTVLARVYSNIYEELGAAEQEEFDNISTNNMLEFLADRGFDIMQLIVDESLRYRMELAKLFEIATTLPASATQPAAA